MPERERPLITFYGDDLTGSTDAMEALSSRGVPTVLFVGIPTEVQRARFASARALGLAGTSRSESPDWMDLHLPPAFAWLRSLDAEFCHYKVCSTFDSSPTLGSIGRAIDIGASIFAQRTVPLLVGAPQLRRYTAFGTMFAAYRGVTYRIDRHPVMSRHPVTPMREADLRVHLGRQRARSIGLIDLPMLADADAPSRIYAVVAEGHGAVLIDVADLASQHAAGRALRRLRSGAGPFVAGSSGVEYALLETWAESGMVGGPASFAPPGPVDTIAVVSGSCSPTTERQIRHALDHGFAGIALDPRPLAAGERSAIERSVAQGLDICARAAASFSTPRSAGPPTSGRPSTRSREGATASAARSG